LHKPVRNNQEITLLTRIASLLALTLLCSGQSLLAQTFDRTKLDGSATVPVYGGSPVERTYIGTGNGEDAAINHAQASEGGLEVGGGPEGTPSRADRTPKAQLDCLKAILAALAVAREGGTVGSPAGMDVARAVEAAFQMALDAQVTDPEAKAADLKKALPRQVAHSSFNWSSTGKVPTDLFIEMPQGPGGGPYLLDAKAVGSLAWVASKSKLELINLKGDSAIGPFVVAILAEKPATYQTFVRCLLGDKLIDALQWDEGACKAFVINHERAHAILNDRSVCSLTGNARAEAMFDPEKKGLANLDGLALTMTLADLGKSQHEELARVAAAVGGTIGKALSLAAGKNLC